MDENHRDETGSKLETTEDLKWVLNKKSKLWTPQYAKQEKASRKRRRFSDKTLWDWLNLLGVLAIPFVVTVVGLYLTQQITQQQVQSSERQHQTDVQIAEDQQRETTLKTCIDDIKDLLLNHNLGNSGPFNEASVVARAEVLLTLRQLDGKRKGILVRFLSEASLITGSGNNTTVIALSGADLRAADLRAADLHGADLRAADLHGANLFGADLHGANLRIADLHGANLRDAEVTKEQLAGASTLESATMPDGSRHP